MKSVLHENTVIDHSSELLFPSIEQALDHFELPEDACNIFRQNSDTDVDVEFDISHPPDTCCPTGISSVPQTASPSWDNGLPFALAGLASPSSAQSGSVEVEAPKLPIAPTCLFPLKEMKRPKHALRHKQLLRWDYLHDRMREDEEGIHAMPSLSHAERRELDGLERLAEARRTAKRLKQRERDAAKRSKHAELRVRAMAGDVLAGQECAGVLERRRKNNTDSSERRKRKREREIALKTIRRSLLEPVNFSVLLKQFLAVQNSFTGRLDTDFKDKLCRAAKEAVYIKNGARQKLITADICIIDTRDSTSVPDFHPAMDISSERVSAVVERFSQGTVNVLVRCLYLPVQDGAELGELDAFLESKDPFAVVPAKRLLCMAAAPRHHVTGFNSYSLTIMPASRKRVTPTVGKCQGSDVLDISATNVLTGDPGSGQRLAQSPTETVYEIAKYEMAILGTSDESLPQKGGVVFHGVEGMDVLEKCAELKMCGAIWCRGVLLPCSQQLQRYLQTSDELVVIPSSSLDLTTLARDSSVSYFRSETKFSFN